MKPRTITTLAVAATLLLLAGCTDKPDTVTTTTSPRTTATPPEVELTPNPRLAAEREAVQRLQDFYAAADELGKSGYADLSPITYFLTGDYTSTYLEEVGWLQSQGAVRVGEASQTKFKVVDHHAVEDPFFDDQLTIEVCIDNTNVDVLLPDGSSVIPPERRGRYVATVTMWHWLVPDEPAPVATPSSRSDMWSIAGHFTDGGRPC